MGFRYGEGRYGMGLYSYRADWWHEKHCVLDGWTKKECQGAWTPVAPKPPLPWTPERNQAPRTMAWRLTR